MIGKGQRGEVTKELQSIYFDAVTGKSKKYVDWLTYV
jgi:branched-chain amino acid aminotransferase